MKISTKLMLIIALAAALIGITALSGVFATANILESQIREKFVAVSTYAMEKVHRIFSRRCEDIAKLAADPVIISRRSAVGEISDKLREYKRHFGSYVPYSSISFFDLQGRRIAATEGNGGRYAFPEDWAGMSKDRTVLLPTTRPEPHNGRAFHLAHLVRDAGGAPFGFVVADIPVESLQEIVRRPLGLFKVGGAFNVDLIDAKGLILFSTHGGKGVFGDVSPLSTVAGKTRTGSGSGAVLLPGPSGKRGREIVVFAREEAAAAFPGNEWTLIISFPERAALAPLMELKNRLALVFALIGFFAAGFVLMLSRTISRPLAKLSRAIAEVGKGNLDAVVAVSSDDEIGRLSRVFNSMVGELKQLHDQLQDAASVDSLTGAFNRKRIDEVLHQEVERARRYESPLSLILFDLDHFKGINDTHGHLSGDYILKTVIGIVRDNIRLTDLLGRWGGEEFMLVAPGTGPQQAAELADKIRRCIQNFPFTAVGTVTISCGVAAFLPGDACTDLIGRADDALYRAKGKGRNVVEIFG